MMPYSLTVTISLEDEVEAEVEVDFLPGERPTYDDPGSGDEITITNIQVYAKGQRGANEWLDMTETLLALGFEDKYYDAICEQCNEARPWEIDPDWDRERDQ